MRSTKKSRIGKALLVIAMSLSVADFLSVI